MINAPPPDPEVVRALEDAMRQTASDGRLPCAAAFGLAREFSLSTGFVGETANRLGIKISKCQLGCF